MDYFDLTNYKILPYRPYAYPMYIVDEITNDLEFSAGRNHACIFEYGYSKLCEALNLHHLETRWAVHPDEYFITINKFNLNMDFVGLNEIDKLVNLDNYDEVKFHILLIELLGGNYGFSDGVIIDNKFYKTFNANCFLEFELEMHLRGDNKSKKLFSDIIQSIDDFFESQDFIDSEYILSIQHIIKKFISLKRYKLDEFIDCPDTPVLQKSKLWIIKKFIESKREIADYIKKEGL